MIRILTEAGESIGFGHLTRTLAIGDALIAAGHAVELVVEWAGTPESNIIEDRRWVAIRPWRHDPTAEAGDGVGVVIDSYCLPYDGYACLTGRVRWIAVIDDYYRLPFAVDLVINPNPYAECDRYLPAARRATGGPSRVVLRDAFVQRKGLFQVRHNCEHMVVSLGGARQADLLGRIYSVLSSMSLHYSVVGSAVGSCGDESVCTDPRRCALPTLSSENLARLFLSADLVLSAGGQTLHELACLGVPVIALEQGTDQVPNLAFYRRNRMFGPVLRKRSYATLERRLEQEVARLADVSVRRAASVMTRRFPFNGGAREIANDLASLDSSISSGI